MDNMCELMQKSKLLHPLAKAAQMGSNYWFDFMRLNDDYEDVLTEKEYKRFLIKSQLDKEITIPQYLQFASEVCVVDYIMRKFSDDFCYEPTYNGKKNPECSFKYNNRIVNVEVKAPDLGKRITQENNDGIKMFCAERLLDKEDVAFLSSCIERNLGEKIKHIDRLDNKLKDYLVSAHQKFPKSGEKYFNILVIALDVIPDMDEWFSYIFGDTGAFTHNSYVKEEYDNVDAVLLTNIQHGHMTYEFMENVNLWDLSNYVSLLFLNPQKEHSYNLGEFYFKGAMDLFGLQTRNFLKFQKERCEENKLYYHFIESTNYSDSTRRPLKNKFIIDEKIIVSNIISEWCRHLKEH